MPASREQVASLYADIGMNVTKAQAGARDMSSRLLSLQNNFKTVRDQAKVTGTGIQQAFAIGSGIGLAMSAAEAFVGALGSMKGAFDAGVASVADYDKSLATFQFLTGASKETMDQAKAAANALGVELKLPQFSAADAALAMLDLAKAGLSATDAMNAARPALFLAAGAEASAGDAATLLANTLNEFKLQGSDAGKVADEITAAMKHSGQSLGEMSDALAQGGATFKQANQPLDTFLTLVAELGKAGIRGGQAGNTLNQMMQSMIAPTDQAKGLMQAMGVHVYELGTNKMRPFRDILKEMTPALQRLNEAQRNAYLSTIFGSNAVRAASIIFGDGVTAYDDMAKSLTEVGVAEGLAGAKADSLAGALADIKKEFSTAIFSAIEPYKDEIKGAAQEIGGFLKQVVGMISGVGKSEAGLLGLAAAFTVLGAASVASGDLGGGLEYMLIGVLLIINQIVKAFADLIKLVGDIGKFLDSMFGAGGGGIGGGTVSVNVVPVMSDTAQGEVQKKIDAWSPLTKALLFNTPVVGDIIAIVQGWPAFEKALNLLPKLGDLPSIPSMLLNLLPVVGAIPALSAALKLLPSQEETQRAITDWKFLEANLDLQTSRDQPQAAIADWRFLEANLDLQTDRRDPQGEIDNWAALTKGLDLQTDRGATQGGIDLWAKLTGGLILDPDRKSAQDAVTNWPLLDAPANVDVSRAQAQGSVDQWAILTKGLDVDPDRRATQDKITNWPLLTAYGSLDLSRAEADAKVNGWAPLTPDAQLQLPTQPEFQRLIDTAFPNLKLDVQINPVNTGGGGGGGGLPKGVMPPGAIAGPNEKGQYEYPKLTPYMGGFTTTYEWRAKGGPVEAGRPYIVGEHGPEPFIPSTSGTVLPNAALGGSTVNVNFYGTVYGFADFEDHVVLASKTAAQKGRL